MLKPRMPTGLGAGGKLLWRALVSDGMAEHHVALLTEACRARDRLDRLDRLLRGDADMWARLTHGTRTNDYELHIDDALVKANATAGVLQNLLGKIPAPAAAAAPAKGGTSGGNGNPVTPLDKARQAREQGARPAKSTRARTAARRRPRAD